MPPKRRPIRRRIPKLRYKKLFAVATEGTKTEPQYFDIFRNKDSIIQVRCLKRNRGNSPLRVLRQLKEHLKHERLRPRDEAWIVVDKDQWTDEQLMQLFDWSQSADGYGFALSNPKFEYWLLLHFEDAPGVVSSRQCSDRLRRHLPNFDKAVDTSKFSSQSIENAIERAKQRDNPPCADWPRSPPGTTIYKLVESIRRSKTEFSS